MELIENLITVLAPFDVATNVLSSKSYPTASLSLPLIDTFKTNFLMVTNSDEPEYIKEFKRIVRSAFCDRFETDYTMACTKVGKTLFHATFFDLRYKNMVQVDDKLVVAMEKEYENIRKSTEKSTGDVKKKTAIPEAKKSSEFERYLNEPCIPKESDLLSWWKNNQSRYPVLSRLA